MLRWPIASFAEAGLEPFAAFGDIEWIATRKGFLRHCHERAAIRSDLSDPAAFLDGSVVVVNTYRNSGAAYRETARTLVDVLRCLDDVEIEGRPRSLRWAVNPDAAEVRALLASPATRYFFAGFEAEGGAWETGDGAALDDGAAPGLGPRVSEKLSFADRAIDLSHVRLMRVFHCRSAFDPYDGNVPGRDPADSQTLVRRLLDAGAHRVEGAIARESNLEHARSTLRLLTEPNLRLIWSLKYIESGGDPVALLGQVDRVLGAAGAVSMPRRVTWA